MTRRRFSERDVLEVLYFQHGILVNCYRCKKPLHFSDAEREHLTEIALGGKDEPMNCAYSHKACHALVTNGTKATTAGSSKQRIAKVKRLCGQTKPKLKRAWPARKLQSRPWPK